jgi:nicotinamide-nucleotide amidase
MVYGTTQPVRIRTAEILCVGTELLLGDIVNTNAAFLARRLAELGIAVYHQSVVGDSPERLGRALAEAFAGHGGAPADLVVLSGGLGPTCDDLTCRTAADFFGLPLELHEPSLLRIEAYFAARGKSMTPNNRKQAMLPRGAVVFPNDWGTAPGMAFGDGNRTVILLPGPPCELEPMFDACAAPFLSARTDGILVSRNLHILGMGEAEVEQVLRPLMESSVNPTIAPYCQAGEVRLRITARAADRAEASVLCGRLEEEVRKTPVGAYIYGTDIPNVETGLVYALRERGLTVSCAESCTGGMIGERITAVPGASAVFAGGCITYTNQVKETLLGVDPALIAAHTEVSAEVAAAMARGVRKRLDTDIALSATGYAGPGGGTAENPVGTVYIGLATRTDVRTFRLSWTASKTRGFIREASASFALREALRAAIQLTSEV